MGRPRRGGLAAALLKKKKKQKKENSKARKKGDGSAVHDDDEDETKQLYRDDEQASKHSASVPCKDGLGAAEDTVLEEFRDGERHTEKLLARLHKIELILAHKKSRSAHALDGIDHEKTTRRLQIDGLKELVEKRLERRSNYYTLIMILVFGCIAFATVTVQMDAKRAFGVENAVKMAHMGELDSEGFVMNRADDLLDWIDSAIVDGAFEDAQCGNGQCESPYEYPGFSPMPGSKGFGCEADCGKYKKTSRITIELKEIAQASADADFGWDWSKVARPHKPTFTFNIWSDTMGEWLFEDALVADGSKLLVDVPDGDYKVHLFQTKMMTPLATGNDIEKHLLIPASTESLPERNASASDFHFGDPAEMIASAALLMQQLDDYCWGGNPAPYTQGWDTKCALEPKSHTMLKAMSAYGVRGKVTVSEKGKKEATTKVDFDFCSLVPDVGKGLASTRNKEMLMSAAIPCTDSQSYESALPVRRRSTVFPSSHRHLPEATSSGLSLRRGGSVGLWSTCSAHLNCSQAQGVDYGWQVVQAEGYQGTFCRKMTDRKEGICDFCDFCQHDQDDAVDGKCPSQVCRQAGGLPKCINGTLLASYINSDKANSTTCASTASFTIRNFHAAKETVEVVPAADKSPPARFLTPFNQLLGPVLIDQTRYAEAVCKHHGNAYVTNFSADFPCLATGSISVGDDAATSTQDMSYSKGADASSNATLDDTPFGLDPVFLPTSELYDGTVFPHLFYQPAERKSVPLDFAKPDGPSRLHVPMGFFPHGWGAEVSKLKASREKHFLQFIDTSCSGTQAHRMVSFLRDGRFLDDKTKEVSVESVLFNVEHKFLVKVEMLFTWQIGGSVTWDYKVMPVPLSLYTGDQHVLEALCLALTACYILAELYQIGMAWRARSLKQYFESIGNWLDAAHLGMLLWCILSWLSLIRVHQEAIRLPNATSVLADPSASARLFQVDAERAHTWLAFLDALSEVAHQRQLYSAIASTTCLFFVFRLIKDVNFQPKVSMVGKILLYSGYDQLHFLVLTSIVWISFCIGSVIAFGHQFESFTTLGKAAQIWFDAMMTWDPSLFMEQMEHAAYHPLVFHIFFWTFFVLFMVLILNILVCLFVDAYCIVVEEARNATPMWTELYDVMRHDALALFHYVQAGFRPSTRFMSDDRLMSLLHDANEDLPPAGYSALRALVMQQLDHHKERVVQTGDPAVNITPYEVLEMVRGIDQAHDADELRKRRSSMITQQSLSSIPAEEQQQRAGDGVKDEDESEHTQVFLHMDDKQRNIIMNQFSSRNSDTQRDVLNTELEVAAAQTSNTAYPSFCRPHDEPGRICFAYTLLRWHWQDLGRLILLNIISDKDVSEELRSAAMEKVFRNDNEEVDLSAFVFWLSWARCFFCALCADAVKMTVKCASTHAILNIEQRMVQDLMERFGTTEAELEEEHIEGILDVISSEVKYNKILLSRGYVDMANRMKNISILGTELCRYETSKKTYARMTQQTDAPHAVKKFKKSVADLVAQKRVLRAARNEDAAAKLGDILQLTIVEAVNLDMLDRFTKVDASCVGVLTDGEGEQVSKTRLSTDIIFDQQDPRWQAQFVVPLRHASTLVIQVVNNNESVKSRMSAVACKRKEPHGSEEVAKLKSQFTNLGTCFIDLERLEHWKETDEWYPIVNHASKHDCKAKLRVQCCRVPNSIAAARMEASMKILDGTSIVLHPGAPDMKAVEREGANAGETQAPPSQPLPAVGLNGLPGQES